MGPGGPVLAPFCPVISFSFVNVCKMVLRALLLKYIFFNKHFYKQEPMMGSCNKKIICVRSLHFNLVANDKGSQNACSKYQPQTNWT